MGIFQNNHEAQGVQRPDALHLAQDLRLRIVLCGYLFEFALILPVTLRQLRDGLQQGPESWHKLLGHILEYLLVKAPRRALGQAMSEGLDRTADVVDELRARELTNASRGERMMAKNEPGSPHLGA